jgi:maltooligosyltrehalose trehalohydrolase
MLFMGEEYGERAPFPYFIDHGDPELVEAVRGGRREEFAGADWDGGIADPAAVETFTSAVLDPSIAENKGPHRDLLTFYIDLLRIRRDHPVLVDRAAKQSVSDQDGVVVLRRRLGKVSSSLILNFTEQDHLDEEAGSIIIDSGPTKGQMVAPFSARLHIDDD